MNKKAKYTITVLLLCCVWLFSPLASVPLSENMTARAASSLWNGDVAGCFAGGTGTETDPYLISTAEQLAYFSQQVNSGNSYLNEYIKLTQDILLNEMNADGSFVSSAPREFTCIGDNGDATGNNGGFMGTFDGNGKRVSGLYINQPDLDNQGLFGFANDYSVIKSVGVTGSVRGRDDVGGVVGRTRGTVQMCYSSCNVTGITNVGGVAGNADQHSIVKNCYNTGQVTGSTYVGGVSGIIDKQNVVLDNNYSCSTVSGSQYVGGVAGANEHDGTVFHNYYDSNNFAGEGIGVVIDGVNTSEDVTTDDGAVGYSSSTMQDISVVDLLNTDNPDGSVWILDTPVINDGYPILGTYAPFNVESFKIAEGKHYTADAMTASEPVTVTADSVFTVDYCLRYAVNCNMAAQTLGLTNNGMAVELPAGASIIMLAEGSYYYVNLTCAANKISLGEFIKMGTTEHFAPAAQAQPDDLKEYLFIFDLTKATSQITTGTCQVELLTTDGEAAGTMPSVTIAGVNTYSLTASGATGSLDVSLSGTPVFGYDYKTDGKIYAYELYLAQNGVAVPWPVGTKINGTAISSVLPYAFTGAALGDAAISIDLADCLNPLPPGSYDVRLKTYACTDAATPRSGYLLANGAATLTLTAPVQYAIKVSAPTRVFDKSAFAIPVAFNIQTLGSGTVKTTLQRKYGMSYVNIPDQTDLPVSVTGGSATLTIPAGYTNGTYRFALTLYDNSSTARARAVESVIIK